jgi:hypothetical protein
MSELQIFAALAVMLVASCGADPAPVVPDLEDLLWRSQTEQQEKSYLEEYRRGREAGWLSEVELALLQQMNVRPELRQGDLPSQELERRIAAALGDRALTAGEYDFLRTLTASEFPDPLELGQRVSAILEDDELSRPRRLLLAEVLVREQSLALASPEEALERRTSRAAGYPAEISDAIEELKGQVEAKRQFLQEARGRTAWSEVELRMIQEVKDQLVDLELELRRSEYWSEMAGREGWFFGPSLKWTGSTLELPPR